MAHLRPPEPGTARADATLGPRSRLTRLFGIAAFVLLLDQLTKAWALSELRPGVRHVLLGDLLGIQLVFNAGAALSLGTHYTWVLTVFSLVAIACIVWMSQRLRSAGWTIVLGLVLGGAVGNLVDRLARDPGFGRGRVVDFIAYGNLFVGNVADIAIVVAAALSMVLSVRRVR